MNRKRRRQKKEAEYESRRHKALARTAALRVFVTPEGRFHLVGGRPEFRKLRECLVQWGAPPRSSVTGSPIVWVPGPESLGFPVSSDGELTKHGMTLCAKVLAKWRQRLDREIRARKLERRRRREIELEYREIDRLSARLREIRQCHRDINRGGAFESYFLTADDEAELARQRKFLERHTGVDPRTDWYARLVLWTSGRPALQRYVDAVVQLRATAQCSTATKLEKLRARIRTWQIRCGGADAYEMRRIHSELRNALSRLTYDMRQDVGGARLRGRSLLEHLQRLDGRCARSLERLYHCRSHALPARLAALVICDGGRAPVPTRLIRDWALELNLGYTDAVLSQLTAESDRPAYDELLLAIDRLPSEPYSSEYGAIRAMLADRRSFDDVTWAQEQDVAGYFDDPLLSPTFVRSIVRELKVRGIDLTHRELCSMLDAVDAKKDVKILRKFSRWVARLPERPVPPRTAKLISKSLVDLVRPGMRIQSHDLLHAWANIPRRPRRLSGEVAAANGEVAPWLDRVGHYQRLAGNEPSVPKSIRKQLDAMGRDDRERGYLEGAAARNELTESQQGRLRLLRERTGKRAGKVGGRPQTRLLRSALEVFVLAGIDALRAVLDRAAQRGWQNMLEMPAPDVSLRRRLDMVQWVCRMDDDQRRVMREICDTWRAHGADYRLRLSGNRSWIEKATARGMDLDAWFFARPADVEIQGKPVRIEPSTNPLETFRMGSYFNTCLSFDDINEMSVLANAYDANKQVIYVRDRNGTVMARQLVTVSTDFLLLTYCCYVNSNGKTPGLREAAIQAVAEYCGRWARRCRIQLGDSGEPEEIADNFWYDDGCHAWDEAGRRAWKQQD